MRENRMMRKILITLLVLTITCIGFTGCGSTSETQETTVFVADEQPTNEDEDTDSDGEKKTTTEAKGSEASFIKRITGLWLNGCQNAASAKESAKVVGCTDVSMTEFVERGGKCYMSTYGDIEGEYDGDTVPALSNAAITFSYISPDYTTAKGTVDGKEISFDMGAPNDQVILYSCGGYYTHCAYNGFSSFDAMNDYLLGE